RTQGKSAGHRVTSSVPFSASEIGTAMHARRCSRNILRQSAQSVRLDDLHARRTRRFEIRQREVTRIEQLSGHPGLAQLVLALLERVEVHVHLAANECRQ